jgi:hypothetical protein
MDEYQEGRPAIVIVPLARDGCVDTVVDADLVLTAINLRSGCKGVDPRG